jgi:hypothetical protein
MSMLKQILITLFCVKPSFRVITLTQALELNYRDLAAQEAILDSITLKMNKGGVL